LAAVAVVALTIAVIGPAIRSLLVFAIRVTALLPSGFLAATITAIAVATITAATDVENGPTVIGNTDALAENNPGVLPPHPHPIAGWTSGPPS
jgi:hypothetical protein